MLRVSLYFMFAVYMVLSLYLIKLGGSLPLRTVYAVGLVLFIFLFVSRKSVLGFVRKNPVIGVAVVMTSAGSFATMSGLGDSGDAINFSIKWILQPLIIMCLSYQVSLCLGPLRIFKLVLSIYCVTFLVAVLQGLNISAAWELKYFFDSFQDLGKEVTALDEIEFESTDGTFDDASRARGLSWSAVHLSYQACLAIGMLFLTLVDEKYRPLRMGLLGSLAVGALAVLAVLFSGTRSAFAGLLVLPMLYWLVIARSKLVVIVATSVVIFCAIYVLPLVQEALNLRVLQAQDSSASMRLPLYLFGLELYIDQPWGYGWIDQSTRYAQQYWESYRHMEGAESIFLRGLHNYILNIVWVYGSLGLIAILYLFWYFRMAYGVWFLVALAPYLVNSLFHNGGVFYGGNYIWVFIGIAKYLHDQRAEYRERRQVLFQRVAV